MVIGKVPNFDQIVIIFKNKKYCYNNLTEAVEALCKCFYALQSWPPVSDHIFYFFSEAIFKLETNKKNITSISSLMTDIKI